MHKQITELIDTSFAVAVKERKETTGRKKKMRRSKMHIQIENMLKTEHL